MTGKGKWMVMFSCTRKDDATQIAQWSWSGSEEDRPSALPGDVLDPGDTVVVIPQPSQPPVTWMMGRAVHSLLPVGY
jgi:hypothetical protein